MKITVIAIALTLCSVVAAAQEPSLYQLTIEDVPTGNGKQTVTFKEIERTPTTSIVELSALAGGSVSGPMLIVRCICGLTRARGEQFFTLGASVERPAAVSRTTPVRLEITFPKSGPTLADVRDPKQPMVFSMAQCDLLKF